MFYHIFEKALFAFVDGAAFYGGLLDWSLIQILLLLLIFQLLCLRIEIRLNQKKIKFNVKTARLVHTNDDDGWNCVNIDDGWELCELWNLRQAGEIK